MVPNESKLLELLSNHNVTFFIPPYQRNYEWDREQCEAFLTDVIKTAKVNRSGGYVEHFFGSVTYFSDNSAFGQPSKLVLIDGQQRITTTMLFLAAVRDLTDDEGAKAFINDNYLKNSKASADTEYKIKLKQTETDWNVYCNIIFSQEPEGADKNSAVYQNYLFFKRSLSGDRKPNFNALDLIQHGLNKFSVITIELRPAQNSWENPQEIFESMNSLGKSLSLADLVRNYLLLGMSASKQETLYKQYWLPMERRLPKRISDFIRDYMQLETCKAHYKATPTNYKFLYASFKAIFDKSPKTDLTKGLCQYSTYYAYIVTGATTENPKVDGKLADIRQIGVTTSYSFLMGLLASWKEKRLTDTDMLTLLDVLLVYFIRRRIIGVTAAENKNVPELAARIEDIEQAEDKKAYLYQLLSSQESNSRVPNDAEVERQLSAMNFYNFKYARLILSMVEESLTKLRPKADGPLSIEHIMPQEPNAQWKSALKDDPAVHDELVHNIGNLTLITHNSELGNKSFDEKKKIYKEHEPLQIARTEIINRDTWNRASIENRAKWMIMYILREVLPIPEEMRHANNFSAKKPRSLSFSELSLLDEYITFTKDKSIKAQVVSDNEVLFEGKRWRLSPLTKELETRRGTVTKSGSYQGAAYWEYDGNRLVDMMNTI
ncbi:MAG: DUF262 domain-containing protein [Oscillibacter sp.]|nr:DUF262 domain-containing protein [Oscillibacter sp.]